MKYSIVAFVFFMGIVSLSNANPLGLPSAPIKIGSVLQGPIANAVAQIVQLVASTILKVAPASTPVPVQGLLLGLKSLPSPTVANVLVAVLTLLNLVKFGPLILGALPKVVANAGVNIPNFVSVLISKVPPGCSTIPLQLLLALLGAYLNQLLTALLVNLLNSLS